MSQSQSAVKKIFIIFPILLLAVFVLGGCQKNFFNNLSNKDAGIEVSNTVQPGQVAVLDSNVIVTNPLSNQIVESPVAISGRARVPQGLILFRVRDGSNNIIATSSSQIGISAPDWGIYNKDLSYPTPFTETGFIDVYTTDEDDGSESNVISLPVRFKIFSKPKVKVFFSNINQDPELLNCGTVYAVDREIDKVNQAIAISVSELLAGPSEEEQKLGFISNIPEADIKIQKLEVNDGVLTIDFNKALDEGVAGSCRVIAIRAQITETLKQFGGVSEVVISIDGDSSQILQP